MGCCASAPEGALHAELSTVLQRSSPNEFFLAPSGFNPHFDDPSKRMEAPNFDGVDVDALAAAWHRVLERNPRVATDFPVNDESGHRIVAVQRSALCRFPDVVVAEIMPSRGNAGSTLAVLSRSVMGYGDLDVNEERILLWLQHLFQELESKGSGES